MDGVSVRGLDIPSVVQKIIGPPNSRVTLEIFRPNDTAFIPPTPVMVAPFERKELIIRRELTSQDIARNSKVAGLGILFHKVLYCFFSVRVVFAMSLPHLIPFSTIGELRGSAYSINE